MRLPAAWLASPASWPSSLSVGSAILYPPVSSRPMRDDPPDIDARSVPATMGLKNPDGTGPGPLRAVSRVQRGKNVPQSLAERAVAL